MIFSQQNISSRLLQIVIGKFKLEPITIYHI